MRLLQLLFPGLLAAALVCGCSSSNKAKVGNPAEPAFSVALFSSTSENITNPYFPLVIGAINIYVADGEDGKETIIVEVLDEVRIVAGIECRIVRDRVYREDLLIEDTHDFYAQDSAGNVWYMGEEVDNYEYDDDGNLIETNNDGAWEAGLDVANTGTNAVAGIWMKTSFSIGDIYAQEIYPGEAEDMGEIIAVNVPITVNGTTYSCVQIRDFTPLDPTSNEYKYFAPGVGLVMESNVDGSEPGELFGTFDGTLNSLPILATATFTNPAQLTNPYFPYSIGEVKTHAVATEDGVETIAVEMLDETVVISGITCAVIRDQVFLDGLLVEDTRDYYAQDDAGNIWYLGEDVVNYEYDDEGNLLGTDSDGSFIAGEDGAQAGILVYATPVIGRPFRQEYYEGEAEDMALVVGTNKSVTLANGMTFTGCTQTLEWNPLGMGALEYKFAAPGVGTILEVSIIDGEQLEYLGTFVTNETSVPDYDAATFANPTAITHPFLPLTVGNSLTYEVETDDGTETIVIDVLNETRVVDGVTCVVVRDQVFLDGVIIEDTKDWFAQDDAGNIWYFGEEVTNYEYDDDGNLLGTDDGGSWEAGVDGAQAGIQLWATPVVGSSYYQEFYEDEAEDMAIVVATGVTVVLGDGRTFTNCIQVLEWTPLAPDAIEYKWYAPGVGLIAEQGVLEEERVELSPDE